MKLSKGKMNCNFVSKGIFVFSDPAGANTILAIIDSLLKSVNRPGIDFRVFTDNNGVFPARYHEIVEIQEFKIKEVKNIMMSFKPNYIFTATSIKDYEHNWRKIAAEKNIKTISFIDHWTSYCQRFNFNNETIFGDEIWVINEIAKREAIVDGVPEQKIFVKGNPYYDKVKNYKPEISKQHFYKENNINLNKKTILFISDDIKQSFPKNNNGDCVLGFDEYTVLIDILNAFISLDNKKLINWNNFQLIIKLHPRGEPNKFDNIIKKLTPLGLDIICIKNCDPLTLNYYSDFVLGMFSNMIIESLLMGKKVLRVQTCQIGEDILKFNEVRCNIIKEKYNLENGIIDFIELT